MSKTTKKYKGKEHTAKDHKKWKDKKHFGETSGSHSHRDFDQAPIKGKDFIKYGYPAEMRKGIVIKNLQKERDADNQIEELNAQEKTEE
jgi:hypothetical protein